MTNRLIHETSPYLIQHADNPVDWYPWGDEALQKAASTNRPIFLSIGYSACHWCHVMAHESFESEDVAAFLNSHFVSVKVDREERPDIDSIYMAAVQALTGGGGWPMSVFLTPHGDPFYGGTYFPSVPRRGLPSFPQVLEAVAKAWQTRPNDLIAESHRLSAILRQGTCYPSGATAGEPSFEILAEAFRRTYFAYDREDGGWGTPKFPLPMILEFLLRYDHLAQDSAALGMVTHTLETMARGGLYDHLGGGFHRYCVDRSWTVPHFEKMLCDNAQLARVYLHAWQVTGESLYRSITEETLDYVAREMTDPRGGFYSSEDADSEGEEGKFFLWRREEIHRLLGPDAPAFCDAHGITHQGNFEGQNVIRFSGALSTRASFATSRQKLLEARALRTRPARDDKVLTSWNGLMLAAFSEAARTLERPDYLAVAERNANFLLTEMWSGERLFHAWRRGTAKQNAFLEDYACLLEGLIELYQTSFDSGLCMAAQDIASRLTALFAAPDGGFYNTSHDHEPLVLRPRDLQDNAMPSGNAMASNVLLRLGALAANAHYVDLSLGAMRPLQSTIAANPLGYGQWLQAACAAVSQPCEVAICGELEDVRTRAMLSVVRSGYRPFQMVAVGVPTVSPAAVPLLRERSLINGEPTAYVCSGAACQAPVGDPEALESLLEQFAPLRRARGFRTE